MYVYFLAFTSSSDETKSTCTVGRLFAFTANHLPESDIIIFFTTCNFSLTLTFESLATCKSRKHSLQLQPGPGWFRKQNSGPRRGLFQQPGRGATPQKIKILIKHCDKRKLKMCKFMIVQVIFFVANLKPFD